VQASKHQYPSSREIPGTETPIGEPRTLELEIGSFSTPKLDKFPAQITVAAVKGISTW
jgi:hypothetical protein